ncbi:MAG: hypothetical protein Q4P72_00525, partial [Eubacteriales bacterium]|nr:hypothetical protein [Eubacteriales bacterium]
LLRKHMTFREAARQARQLRAKSLILTHFSAAIKDPSIFIENARSEFPEVRLAEDLMQLSYGFEKRNEVSDNE